MGIEDGKKSPEVQEIKPQDKMEVLNEKGIVSFDANLTPEEKKSIEEIRIEKTFRNSIIMDLSMKN